MKDVSSINSNVYWDHRFTQDWGNMGGPRQSRFFYEISIKHLPDWFFKAVNKDNLSIVDWGCAEGDGADVLASIVRSDLITGVDFSEIAISSAQSKYPHLSFECSNWLIENNNSEKFDVVFSSNTLEHFHTPFNTLEKISAFANKAIVLVLPFRETERHEEHFFTFLSENIPASLSNGFILQWSNIINCAAMEDSMWPGEQITLLYACPIWLSSLNLMLSDCRVENDSAKPNMIAIQYDNISKDLKNINDQFSSYIHRSLEITNEREDRIKKVEECLLQELNEIKTEIIKQHHLSNSSSELRYEHILSSIYWKRRLCKKLCVKIYLYMKPYLKKLTPYIPLTFSTKIKQAIENRIFSSSPKNFSSAISSKDSIIIEHDIPSTPLFEKAYNTHLNGQDVIVFPVIDWEFRLQRPQHLSREIAKKGHRVFYFCTTFNHSDKTGYSIISNPEENIYICKLNLDGQHPVIYQSPPEGETLSFLVQSLDVFRTSLNINNSISIIDLPFWHRVADSLPSNWNVYDCMDYHAGFSTNSDKLHEQEDKLLREADLVITTAERLSNLISKKRDNVIIRNAAEVEFFGNQCTKVKYETTRKVVGYYGAISEWFDIDLVITGAEAYPEWDFVLVGNTFGCDISRAKKIKNIKFIGEVPYKDLLGYLSVFDVCIIPFKLVELTLCTNPVKVYEYLAAGKPVVATAMPEIVLIENMVHVVNNEKEYIEKLSYAMEESTNKDISKFRKQWAMQHDWASRANDLQLTVAESYPKVSVIVLTYNNLDLTKACLDSIERFTNYPNLELILVDNASVDGTPKYLKEYASTRDNIVLCLNETNLGFSGGNNVGLKIATGEYLVILNNDTYVTDGWVHGLLRGLRRNEKLGLVGPVTRNIGNEAKINIEYTDMEEMASKARSYTLAHTGDYMCVRTAAFFCVMFSKKTYEKIGLMDETFGVGFFEDDDYCNRIHQAGYDVAILDDVFIHHHLSASFDKMKATAKQALMERNKEVYEKKWGKWIPHRYRKGVF
ncbi:putative teichuronic acid biosynthesis glycosyltransferase TuaH [compost metagenome]